MQMQSSNNKAETQQITEIKSQKRQAVRRKPRRASRWKKKKGVEEHRRRRRVAAAGVLRDPSGRGGVVRKRGRSTQNIYIGYFPTSRPTSAAAAQPKTCGPKKRVSKKPSLMSMRRRLPRNLGDGGSHIMSLRATAMLARLSKAAQGSFPRFRSSTLPS